MQSSAAINEEMINEETNDSDKWDMINETWALANNFEFSFNK